MLNEKSVQLLEERIKDQAFVDRLIGSETEQEVVSILTEEGIDITEEEVVAIKKSIVKRIENNDELDDSELEEVSGGVLVAGVVTAVAAIFGSVFSVGSLTHTMTRRRW